MYEVLKMGSLTHGGSGEKTEPPASGKQEYLKGVINQIMFGEA